MICTFCNIDRDEVVTAIRLGVPVASAGTALYPNAERHLRSRVRLARIYPPELIRESACIAERCDFDLDTLRYEYPAELVPESETPASHLRRLTEAGVGFVSVTRPTSLSHAGWRS